MSDRVDHRAEALIWLETVSKIAKTAVGRSPEAYLAEILPQIEAWDSFAQVHATLALAEEQSLANFEQRTANLIAFYEMDLRRGAFDAAGSLKLFLEIRDRLGLL